MDAIELQMSNGGRHGVDLIKDTSAHTGVWSKVNCYETTVFTKLTLNGVDLATAGESIVAGFEIQGKITAITLASGACFAYKAPN